MHPLLSEATVVDGALYTRCRRCYLWRDLVALRRTEATAAEQQPTLFTLPEDHRPAGECNAAERYREPNLFTALERSR